MCLGVPLKVSRRLSADTVLCTGGNTGLERRVLVSLLDAPPDPGDWLLVHVDVAIRPLAAAEAQQIGRALEAVDAAARGRPFEHLLADLIDREPALPAHLQAQLPDHNKEPI